MPSRVVLCSGPKHGDINGLRGGTCVLFYNDSRVPWMGLVSCPLPREDSREMAVSKLGRRSEPKQGLRAP